MSQWRSITITVIPNEMLNRIASHLPREDLIAFRAVGNRNVRDGTDSVYRQLYFSSRVCWINNASITRLYELTGTRFAESIRYITIRVDLECQVIMEDSDHVGAIERVMEPQLTANASQPSEATIICLFELCWKLEAIFKNTANLKGLSIYAPSAKFQLSDNTVICFPEPCDQGPYSMIVGPTPFDNPFSFRFYLFFLFSRSIYSKILAAIVRSKLRLEDFRMLEFTQSIWQTHLGAVQPMFQALVEQPGVRQLTHLQLELDRFADTNGCTIPYIVCLIAQNRSLRTLKLSTRGRSRENNWHLLLDALAHQPPFKLRELFLTGAIANSNTTLDKVINAHTRTLRHLVLNELIFDLPNSLRAFLRALSRTEVEYFATRHFLRPHLRSFVSSRDCVSDDRDDEVLEWHDADANSLDTSYQGWVVVGEHIVPHTRWVIWYDGRGIDGADSMALRMKRLIEELDASRIHD